MWLSLDSKFYCMDNSKQGNISENTDVLLFKHKCKICFNVVVFCFKLQFIPPELYECLAVMESLFAFTIASGTQLL